MMRKREKWILAAVLICGTMVLVSCSDNADNSADSGKTKTVGSASFHENDYPLYYFNIKANAAARVAAYLSK